MSPAIKLIMAERERQIADDGYTPYHDDFHISGELAAAAACYVLPPEIRSESLLGKIWPWDADEFKPTPHDPCHDLVKAGALIVAEIERLQRNREGRVS